MCFGVYLGAQNLNIQTNIPVVKAKTAQEQAMNIGIERPYVNNPGMAKAHPGSNAEFKDTDLLQLYRLDLQQMLTDMVMLTGEQPTFGLMTA